MKAPNRLGPSRPKTTTIARENSLLVAVWATPEKFGKTVSCSNRPPVINGRQCFVDLQFLSTSTSIKGNLQKCVRLKDQTVDEQAYELTEVCRATVQSFKKNGDGQTAPEWICPDCYVKAIHKLINTTTEDMLEVD